VTQLCVVPGARRSLVAAALLQAQYDRSAYGCRLYSCWCAQDLAANRFWEALGYVPIAFRAGARGKGKGERRKAGAGDPDAGPFTFERSPFTSSARTHIFWQKKIRGDDDPVSYWYPSQTGGGALRADRLVFPIPAGWHWSDDLPQVLPELEEDEATSTMAPGGTGRTHSDAGDPCRAEATRGDDDRHGSLAADVERPVPPADRLVYPDGIEERDGFLWKGGKRQMTREMILREQGAPPGGLWYIPGDAELVAELPTPTLVKAKAKKAKPKEKAIDPRLVAMARELRDRWFERQETAALPMPRHDVRRLAA